MKAQTLPGLLALPLLAPRDLSAPLAWRSGRAISGAQFIGEALALAQQLPAAGRPINLCQDRYLFALGMAAALMRGQTSLLDSAVPTFERQPRFPLPASRVEATRDVLPWRRKAP